MLHPRSDLGAYEPRLARAAQARAALGASGTRRKNTGKAAAFLPEVVSEWMYLTVVQLP
jgi:hypothetical protein